MLDDKAMESIARQLGNLGINNVSLERDLELLQETLLIKHKRIDELEKALSQMTECRDGLQREVHRLEGLIPVVAAVEEEDHTNGPD
jgi:uncharacterized coiled-coil DUF342 family protein